MSDQALISIIIPMNNEAENVRPIYDALKKVTAKLPHRFEYIFINDGSVDDTDKRLLVITRKDTAASTIELARNFGKEIALTAGLHAANGDAAIMIDADLQHPPELIPEFIDRWQNGADIVIGVNSSSNVSWARTVASGLFYAIINRVSDTKIIPRATDYRLVDRDVITAFNQFTERNRITRGLFDWLGFNREVVSFNANERHSGKPSYSVRKLIKLASDSFIGHTLLPLRLAGLIGSIIIILSGPLGLFIFIERYVFHDRWSLHFSGPAILAVINLFLSGVILSCIGFMSMYLANVHAEVINRPLYVVRPNTRKRRAGIKEV